MIKLKVLLLEQIDEAKKLDLTKVDDAAEFIIRQAWKLMGSDDKFSDYQVRLYIDNDAHLLRASEKFAEQFFPNDKDPAGKFDDVIDNKLEDLEKQKHSRMAKKINPNDPLFILKSLIQGKTYEGAKQTIVNNSLGAYGYRGGKISDEEAETTFNRMYKNAMGETVYDEKRANQYGRLSDIRHTNIQGDYHHSQDAYALNIFIDQYVGYGAEKFPNKVKVYRGVNNPTVPIRPGDYVTFDKRYASSYERGKFGAVISNILDSKDLFVYRIEPDSTELVYWPAGHQIKKYNGQIPSFKDFYKMVNHYGL